MPDADWERALAVAREQWGVITRAQLLAAGVSRSRIDRLGSRGVLHRLYRGVYAVGHDALDERARLTAAILHGHASMLGGPTALWWWQVTPAEPKLIHVISPSDARRVDRIVIARAAGIEAVVHRGLPVCPVERALIDAACLLSAPRIRKTVSEALYLRLTTVDAIEMSLSRGLPGSAAVRAALERHRDGTRRTRSELEERFLIVCERARLPRPKVNVRIAGREVDFAWPKQQLVVEVDGPGHGEIARIAADRATEMALRRAGWGLIRYSGDQIVTAPRAIADELRRRLVEPIGNRTGG